MKLKQTVFKLFFPKSGGIFRLGRRIPLPEPAFITNLYPIGGKMLGHIQGFVINAG
jgi:hypothetical protein